MAIESGSDSGAGPFAEKLLLVSREAGVAPERFSGGGRDAGGRRA